MSKQTEKFVKGAFILTIAGLLGKLISIFYKIPLTNLVGETGVGYYETVFPIYALLTSAALVGIPNTISKIISQSWSQGRYKQGHRYFIYGLWLSILMGVILTSILLFGQGLIIKAFGWDDNYRFVLYGFAISPVFVGVTGAIKGYFQGMQKMAPSAIGQLLENIMKVLIGIGLVIILLDLGQPLQIATAGAAVGASFGFIASAIYMVLKYRKMSEEIRHHLSLDTSKQDDESMKVIVKYLLKMAIPITIVAAAYSIMRFVDSATLYRGLARAGWSVEEVGMMVGRLGKVLSVINVPLTISVAVSASVVPAISSSHALHQEEELEHKVNVGLRLALLFSLPAMTGIFVLASPILKLLFPRTPEGSELLQLYAIGLVFMILSQTIASMLQGIAKHQFALYALGIAATIKFVMHLILLPQGFGVSVAVYSTIMFYGVFFLLCYVRLKQVVNYKLDIRNVFIKPLISSVMMGLVVKATYTVIMSLLDSNALATLSSVFVGMFVYLVGLVLLHGLYREDLSLLPKRLSQLKWLHNYVARQERE